MPLNAPDRYLWPTNQTTQFRDAVAAVVRVGDEVANLRCGSGRFLKPGGRLIPARIRLQLGAVESEKGRDKAEGWRAEGVPPEFHWLRQQTVNAKHAIDLPRDALLGGPADLGDIDLYADNPDFFSWTADLRIERDGVDARACRLVRLRASGGRVDDQLAAVGSADQPPTGLSAHR